MTDLVAARRRRRPPGLAAPDVVDADFETLRTAPGVRPPPTATLTRSGIETLGAHGQTTPPGRRRGGLVFWLSGIASVFAAFWMSGGHALVSTPAVTDIALPKGLVLTGVTYRVEPGADRPVLHLDGHADNASQTATALPPIEVRIGDADGRITRFRVGTGQRTLAPGERFAFSSRVGAPIAPIERVTVAFAEPAL